MEEACAYISSPLQQENSACEWVYVTLKVGHAIAALLQTRSISQAAGGSKLCHLQLTYNPPCGHCRLGSRGNSYISNSCRASGTIAGLLHSWSSGASPMAHRVTGRGLQAKAQRDDREVVQGGRHDTAGEIGDSHPSDLLVDQGVVLDLEENCRQQDSHPA